MLLNSLINDLNTAMKAHDKVRVETLRYLVAAVKKYDIDTYSPANPGKLTDDEVLKIIRKQVKTHEESIAAFEKGARPDLVEKEKAQLAILKTYVPAELSDQEIRALLTSIKSRGIVNFGPLMGAMMKEVAGRAGGDRVAKIVNEVLQK
ncbi:MAG: GatB/YqeY domain-containing protein [Patescibacteria group bacterium]